MSKKLTQSKINQLLAKQYSTKVLKIEIDGGEYEFNCQTTYDPVSIEHIISEFMEFIEYAEKNEYHDYNVFTGVILEIVKHFVSDLEFKTKGNTKARFEDLIKRSNALKKLICSDGVSVFDKLVGVVVIQEEVDKISTKIKEMRDNVDKFNETLKEQTEVVEDANV